jgi:carboxypeptidase T
MKIRPRLFLLSLIIMILVIAGSFFLDQNQKATAADQTSTSFSLGVEQSQGVVINLYYDSQEQLNAVAGQLDIWEVHPLTGSGTSAGYAVVAVDPAQLDWLQTLGYRVEIDPEKTALLQAPAAALNPRYYYFDAYNNNSNNRYMVNFLQDTTAAFPGITELLDIGDAWLAGHSGYHRDMWVLRITNEDPQYGEIASKPPFFMIANIHAREVTTPEMAIRYIKYFTSGYLSQGGYGIDPDVTWLVNHHVVYVLVSQNPDGRVINEANSSAWWRKNVDNLNGCSDPNSWGTDLNRNSNFMWASPYGGSSGYPCDETYRGPSRSSEPETAAFQAFASQIFTDWNGNNGDDEIVASPLNASGIFITLHSYADDILWPFGFAPGAAPNDAQLKTIGRKLADITDVMVPTGYIGYQTDGTTDDWVYGKLGVAAFTFEIGPNYGSCGSFFPAYGCQDGIDGMPRNFWAEMGASFVYANKIAATPYITAYGPDAMSLAVNPSEVPGGVPVDLSATVFDQRYTGDPLVPITAAEYFIDAPGADGTGISMSPSDGAWGNTSEGVEAVVDTTGLSEGQHYILVHGKNNNNVWGPFTAVFLNVTTPAYGVILSPDTASAQADPGLTVTYHMQVNNIGLNNDTYDISVNSGWSFTAPSSTGLILPGENATFDVVVTVPVDANQGESDIATVTVTSQFSPDFSDSSSLSTTANYYDLSLTPATAGANGYPGGQVGYNLQLTNMGNTVDTFDIESTSVWTIIAPTTVGPLDPNTSAEINIIVDIPPSVLPGEFDIATISATSQGNGTKTHSSILTTTAVQAGPFVNPASDEGSGDPGTQVVYTLQLTNHNFLPDTFTLSVNTAWGVEYPTEVGPIAPDATTNVTIKVTVPADAAGGAHDTAEVTFASSDPDLPSATATLTTTANNIYSFQAIPEVDTLTGYGKGTTVQYTVVVTNNGNTADTYTILVLPGGWNVDAPAEVGPINPGETASVTISVHVPFDIVMGDSNDATLAFVSQGNSLIGHQVHLYTNTFWYSNFLPLSQKH